MPVDAARWLAQHAAEYSVPHRVFPSAVPSRRRNRLVVVLNAHSGARRAKELWQDIAEPLLRYALPPDVDYVDGDVLETRSPGDGERIGRSLRQEGILGRYGTLVLLVAGGDGTVHELLNGLLLDEECSVRPPAQPTQIVLLPTGTANALYYHSFPPESPPYPPDVPASPFYSLLSFLRGDTSATSPDRPALARIALALNILPPTAYPADTKCALTTVVSSAALHACLLYDAEELRTSHPGLERFKIAAQQNVKRWWHGSLRLQGDVRVYSPARQAWVPAKSEGSDDDATVVSGPFAYLVTALVSRFEQSFVVAPFRNKHHSLAPRPGEEEATIDVVCIRPLRHAPTERLVREGREAEAREGFIQRVWDVTAGMYAGGKHVDARYPREELYESEAAATDGVVEVYRCARATWTPVASEEDGLKSRLVCLDGAVYNLGVHDGNSVPCLGIEGVKEGGAWMWS